ncbi:hypothetical protein OKW43_008085 [Paraburkholderia sp. WC7.3g]|uniref:hypothetical protein n=1 Tax=Paraburkholderia sp. WC7.3g TaxID=2991070 RepID=UPI003D248B1C
MSGDTSIKAFGIVHRASEHCPANSGSLSDKKLLKLAFPTHATIDTIAFEKASRH